jgi:hypothetical protein
MSTKNPRINITIEPATETLLSLLAKREQRSVASLATELIVEALERREDMVLSAVAQKRDIEDAETIEHEDVWK